MTQTAAATIAGTVRFINLTKGFGFVKAEDGREFFFHRSSAGAAFDELYEGAPVKFVPGVGEKGPRTDRVEPA